MMNAILSAQHDVTAHVLADCGDRLSGIRYVRHDVAGPLPLEAATCDVFTSMVSSMCLGPNIHNSNNGWFFDFPTMEKIFAGWQIVDRLVDRQSSPRESDSAGERFVADVSVDTIAPRDYRVVFLQLPRAAR